VYYISLNICILYPIQHGRECCKWLVKLLDENIRIIQLFKINEWYLVRKLNLNWIQLFTLSSVPVCFTWKVCSTAIFPQCDTSIVRTMLACNLHVMGFSDNNVIPQWIQLMICRTENSHRSIYSIIILYMSLSLTLPAWSQPCYEDIWNIFTPLHSGFCVNPVELQCAQKARYFVILLLHTNGLTYHITFVFVFWAEKHVEILIIYGVFAMLNSVLRRISSSRTKLLAARYECMHEHFHPITMLNSSF
jgi:hypothetical protein